MARSSCHQGAHDDPVLPVGWPWHSARRGPLACRPLRALPRDPTASVLYTVVREHVETFRVEAVRLRDGQGLPRFVDAEFDAFLRCGFLAASAPTPPVCHARWEGFDLHAGVRIPAGHRDRLEQVCRYALRPPVAGDHLHLTAAGDVALQLRRPWDDGTTHLVFAPVAFLARLAVLVPRPRVHLVLYHGVLAPRAAWRAVVVPGPSPASLHHRRRAPARARAAAGAGPT